MFDSSYTFNKNRKMSHKALVLLQSYMYPEFILTALEK